MYPGEVKTCTIENCIVEGFIDLLQTSGNTVGSVIFIITTVRQPSHLIST